MKLIVVLCTILAVSQALSYSELVKQWNTFKLQHRKKYASPREDEYRMQIFMETVNKIAKHNEAFARGEVSYKMGLNQFADMTNEEFINTMSGYRRPSKLVRSRGLNYTRQNNETLPSSVDWRQQGAVTPVRNQGECKSCWAFSATGAIEGQHFRKTGQLVSLSVQNLLDCATAFPNDGCYFGAMDVAFQYVVDNGGIDTEDSYPYEAKNGNCSYNAQNVGATISSYVYVTEEDQEALKEAVANVGPVSVPMNAGLDSLKSYSSGIYYDAECDGEYWNFNHAALVVGYGTENGTDYWIVKNSWGDGWGESGYFRISMKDNNCGIAKEPLYPVV